jgi:hypothetical protein
MPTKTTPKRPAASAAKKTPAKAVKATKAVAKKAASKVTKTTKPVAKKAPAKAIKVASPAARKAVTKATSAAAPAAKKTVVATTKAAREVAIPAPFKPGQVDARMPGEQHPGQTSAETRLHDRAGSQLERERHMRPGSTNPQSGAGRTNKRAVKKGR